MSLRRSVRVESVCSQAQDRNMEWQDRFPYTVLVFLKNDILGFLPHEEGILKNVPKKWLLCWEWCSVY